MHQSLHSPRSAALLRLLPDLAETAEGPQKIANMVRDIINRLDEEGLRLVSAKES